MNDYPNLSAHLTNLNQTELEHYDAIIAEVQSYVDTFALPLQILVRPFFERLARGQFSQIAALLPYYLADLLPVSPDICHHLGIAHLYFWWYYYAQDELLDGDAPAAVLLGGHLALLQMVARYERLGLTTTPCWADYHRLALLSAETHALELKTRFTRLDELIPAQLTIFTVDFLFNRVAPFYFNTLAQLHLAGISVDDPRRHDLIAALRCFGAARQLSDDASDWLADLQAGQLNYVSAHLMRRLYQRDLAMGSADLDLERLTGYQLTDELFWNEIEQTISNLNQQALEQLAPYGDCRLRLLIQQQMAHHAGRWAAARTHRANLRRLFGVGDRP